MKVSLPSFETIERRVLDKLNGSPLAGAGPTSIVRLLLRPVIEEIAGKTGLWDSLGQVAEGAHPGTATGDDLDGIATWFGELGKRRQNETDAEYRYRLTQFFSSREPGSLDAILYAVRGLDGITEAQARPFIYGPGSFALAYLGTAEVGSLERILKEWIAPGTYCRIYKAASVPVEVRIGVRLAAQTTPVDRLAAKTAVETALRRLIQSLPMGASLLMDQVRRSAIEAHPSVVSCRIDRVRLYDVLAPIQDAIPPWDGVLTLATASAVEVQEDA